MNQPQNSQDEAQKYPPLGEFDNQKALADLKRKRKNAVAIYITIVACALGVVFFHSGLGTTLMMLAIKQLREAEKFSNVIMVMETILGKFSEQGIETIPQIPVSDEDIQTDRVDLLVRVPDERLHFVICIRKREQCKIVFDENQGKLKYRRKRGLRAWEPDPLVFIARATTWLKKYEGTAFGHSSNDKRRPMARVLLLIGSTKIGQHDSKHYDIVGDKEFVCIKERGRVFIVHHDEICSLITNFIKQNGKIMSKTPERSNYYESDSTAKKGKNNKNKSQNKKISA